MMFLIKNNDQTVGTADYADEAKDFAVRFSGNSHRSALITWTRSGEMVVNGVPSGWQVWVVREQATVLEPA